MLIKILKKNFLISLLTLFISFTGMNINAQIIIESKCPNSDFALRDFTGWTGCYCKTSASSCYTSVQNGSSLTSCAPITPSPTINCGTPGFWTVSTPSQPSLHTIITPQNTSYVNTSSPSGTGLYDSLTNYGLRKIPAGVNQVVRLNSWMYNYQTSQLIYDILVDTNVSGLFVYSYAAVLENPLHGCSDQPYFQIRLLNSSGTPIPSTCGSFTYVAGTPGAFIHNISALSHTICWFDWQTVGLNLKPYHGQNIKVQFIAADCGQGGHFGYAYFYAFCFPRTISINYCPGSLTADLVAPDGFRYKWLPAYNPSGTTQIYSGGDTTQTLHIVGPQDSTVYRVVISSLFNSACTDTLKTILVPNLVYSNFSFNNACVNVPVDFMHTTTSNTPIYSWFWDFGVPGSAGNHMNMGGDQSPVSHTYTTPGNYTVTLIDTLRNGCPDTMTKVVHVYPNPTVSVNSDSICPGDSATLTAQGAFTYNWNDGYTGNPHKVSPTADQDYTVIGTSNNGCQDSAFATVRLYPAPQVSFTADTIDGCEPITTHFQNFTDPPNCTYLWNFGDNTTSTLQDPTHTFHAGIYSITLTAITANNCKAVSVSPNLINCYFQPQADFSWTPNLGLIGFPVNFTNLTNPTNSGYQYNWTFGDNTGGTTKDISHIYSTNGFYNVTLVSISDFNCIDTARYTIEIKNDSLTFPNIITPNNDGFNDCFVIKGLLENNAYPDNVLIVYNRWGKKVYESNNYKNDFNGAGLAEGVYYYVFKARSVLKELEHKGSLEILR